MGKSFQSVLLLVAVILAGCARESNLRLPVGPSDLHRKVTVNAWARAREGDVCDADEADVSAAMNPAMATLNLKDRIEGQRRKMVDCDGVQVSDKAEPTRSFVRVGDLPRTDLGDAVDSVEILNPRSCSITKIERHAGPGETSAIWNQLYSKGSLRVTFTDDVLLYRTGMILVRQGQNPLEIHYLSANGEVLAKSSLNVRLNIERPVIPGENQPQRVPECK